MNQQELGRKIVAAIHETMRRQGYITLACGGRLLPDYRVVPASEIDVIEPGSVYCPACKGDLVESAGCALCGEAHEPDWEEGELGGA